VRTFLSVVVALVLFASPALAQTAAPTRESIERMLSGFETTPTLAQIQALGDGALPLLFAIHDDASVIQPVRFRAVTAVGAFQTADARAFLLRVMDDAVEPTLVRAEAIRALARSQGAGATSAVATYLSSDQRALRESATEALGAIGTASARRLLREHLPQEHDAALRERIGALTTPR
jgi:HEAT repeat protein